jgi:hypothetical protein
MHRHCRAPSSHGPGRGRARRLGNAPVRRFHPSRKPELQAADKLTAGSISMYADEESDGGVVPMKRSKLQGAAHRYSTSGSHSIVATRLNFVTLNRDRMVRTN